MSSPPFTLFEVSWEVCNKVGGTHTVLSSKAPTLVERYGDDYIVVGPWLLSGNERERPFLEEPGHETFCESCRDLGLTVRVGRWAVPGRPRTILIEFSSLYEQRDDVLASLWEQYQVNSLPGGWAYVEPVLFGWAAGQVIERWWEDRLAPRHRRTVVQVHDWKAAATLLYLERRMPSVGTVFTNHATALGRAMSANGHSPMDGLGDQEVTDLAETHEVVAPHSLEAAAVRVADAYAVVSQVTVEEARLVFGRDADFVLHSGVDLEVIDELAGNGNVGEVRAQLARVASAFLGEDLSDAAQLCLAGSYDLQNKGIDLLLEALHALEQEASGRRIVAWILVPAGHSGLRRSVQSRLAGEDSDEAPGITTHNLFDEDADPIGEACTRLGLTNAQGSRIKVVHVPLYLEESDGLLGLSYEALVRALDLTVYPSYYEPWGYAAQESLALGVPTITSDMAGFGVWSLAEGLERKHGVAVLGRHRRPFEDVVGELASTIEGLLETGASRDARAEACRETALRFLWSDRIEHYERAFASASERIQERTERGVPQVRRPARPVAVTQGADDSGPRLVSFEVANTLPPALRGLERLAHNFWWCWDDDARRLFEELSPRGWEAAGHAPVAFLQRVFREDLDRAASDKDYVARLDHTIERFEAYCSTPAQQFSSPVSGGNVLGSDRPVAYFSAEFGLHESLRIYSGGLGVLAGDHLKSASDLALPLVAIGLYYRMGYIRQQVTPGGEQVAVDLENDPRQLPVTTVRGEDGMPLEVRLALPGRELVLRAWKVAVGRVPLYLLDANLPANRPEDRDITRNLYGGDSERRLQQEIVLGRGGVRLLEALGVAPAAWHMNEGHAAFSSLERVASLVREGLTFDQAREYVRGTSVFTTHTPVPAGHDRFGQDLVRRYFSDVADWLGLSWERFYGLGTNPSAGEEDPQFNMTYLALAFASVVNGVSRMHGEVSRKLLHPYWPSLLESEVPVGSVTNGVHLATWTEPGLAQALGAEGRPVTGKDFADRAPKLGVAKLWSLRQAAKGRLLEALHERLHATFLAQCDSPLLLSRMVDGLDPRALVIGFARRFAPYKRAHLIFQDPERLRMLLSDPERPVILLVAGKAHPQDAKGKDILRDIAGKAREHDFVGRVFFIEEYDIDLARFLVQGVDVWLNNPTRLMEASGTSGMKAAANGALNLSIADGWWPEAADGSNGWTIADGRLYEDQALQDQFDSTALYRLLEEELAPLYFEQRDSRNVPVAWLERSRHALATVPSVFNTDRMVGDYLEQAYRVLAEGARRLGSQDRTGARELAALHSRLRKEFEQVAFVSAAISDLAGLRVGDTVDVTTTLQLGELQPEELVVELVLGHALGDGDLSGGRVVVLEPGSTGPEGVVFSGSTVVDRSGSYAYGLRVRTAGQALGSGPLRWA